MRVTFLTHYAGMYGANRSLLDLIDGLSRHGVEASVIAPEEGDLADALKARGIGLLTCTMGRWVSNTPDGFETTSRPYRAVSRLRSASRQVMRNAAALRALLPLLQSSRPDVIYSNSSIVLSGALAARKLAVPHVWHLREFGDLDYDFHLDLGKPFHKWYINRADAVIAVSAALRDHFRLSTPSPIHVVYGGIAWSSEFDRQRDIASRRIPRQQRYTFGLIGLLHPGKGQDVAIRAIARVVRAGKDASLVIAGSGRHVHQQYLVDLVHRLGLQDHVEFRGYVDDVFRFYQETDAILMCSRHEAMGRVTVEAMAGCRPVIGYGSGGTEELIEHEKTGLLYYGDQASLADSMMRFLDRPSWAAELGMNGWESARERFTIERYASNIFSILQRVAGTPGIDAAHAAPGPRYRQMHSDPPEEVEVQQ